MTRRPPSSDGPALGRDPLWRHRRGLKRGGFRTVELNLAGWSALVATGLALGAAAALATDLPAGVALPLAVAVTWAALVVADHLRWRNGTTGLGFGGLDAGTGELIVAELRRRGITAAYREHRFGDGTSDVQRNIECRNADAEAVHRIATERLAEPS